MKHRSKNWESVCLPNKDKHKIGVLISAIAWVRCVNIWVTAQFSEKCSTHFIYFKFDEKTSQRL